MNTTKGLVKWFDAGKGFGFIVADEGGPDILLHANVLRNFGHSSVIEKSVVEVIVQDTERGRQAVEIVSIGPPVGERTSEGGNAGLDILNLVSDEPLNPARVKWFDKSKGFGFVNLFGSTEDIFVHMEVLRAYGMAELEAGEAVCVKTAEGQRGRMAVEIRNWDYAVPEKS